jgi:hypothetical protein
MNSVLRTKHEPLQLLPECILNILKTAQDVTPFVSNTTPLQAKYALVIATIIGCEH